VIADAYTESALTAKWSPASAVGLGVNATRLFEYHQDPFRRVVDKIHDVLHLTPHPAVTIDRRAQRCQGRVTLKSTMKWPTVSNTLLECGAVHFECS
jgi:hypothetical protein